MLLEEAIGPANKKQVDLMAQDVRCVLRPNAQKLRHPSNYKASPLVSGWLMNYPVSAIRQGAEEVMVLGTQLCRAWTVRADQCSIPNNQIYAAFCMHSRLR